MLLYSRFQIRRVAVLRELDDQGTMALREAYLFWKQHCWGDGAQRTDAQQNWYKCCFFLGHAYEQLNDIPQAMDWYQRIIEWLLEKGGSARLFVTLARLSLQAEDPVTAHKHAMNAIRMNVSLPATFITLAMAQLAQGELELAKHTMNEALYREAPRDKRNRTTNQTFLIKLFEEEQRIEDSRKQEQQFFEVWGEVLDAASRCHLSGESFGWESGTLPAYLTGCHRLESPHYIFNALYC